MAEVDYTVARVEDCDTPEARRVNVLDVVPEGTTVPLTPLRMRLRVSPFDATRHSRWSRTTPPREP